MRSSKARRTATHGGRGAPRSTCAAASRWFCARAPPTATATRSPNRRPATRADTRTTRSIGWWSMARPDRRPLLALMVVALLAIPPVTVLFAGTPKLARPYPATLAPGPGNALAAQRCLMCHSATLITQQAKDSAGWARTLGTMKTWGTPLDSAETDTLLRWLVATYGPRPRANPAAS